MEKELEFNCNTDDLNLICKSNRDSDVDIDTAILIYTALTVPSATFLSYLICTIISYL